MAIKSNQELHERIKQLENKIYFYSVFLVKKIIYIINNGKIYLRCSIFFFW